jgi:hypothetical protein
MFYMATNVFLTEITNPVSTSHKDTGNSLLLTEADSPVAQILMFGPMMGTCTR